MFIASLPALVKVSSTPIRRGAEALRRAMPRSTARSMMAAVVLQSKPSRRETAEIEASSLSHPNHLGLDLGLEQRREARVRLGPGHGHLVHPVDAWHLGHEDRLVLAGVQVTPPPGLGARAVLAALGAAEARVRPPFDVNVDLARLLVELDLVDAPGTGDLDNFPVEGGIVHARKRNIAATQRPPTPGTCPAPPENPAGAAPKPFRGKPRRRLRRLSDLETGSGYPHEIPKSPRKHISTVSVS